MAGGAVAWRDAARRSEDRSTDRAPSPRGRRDRRPIPRWRHVRARFVTFMRGPPLLSTSPSTARRVGTVRCTARSGCSVPRRGAAPCRPACPGSISSDGTSEITSTGHTSAQRAHSTHLSTSSRMLAKQRRQRVASQRACCGGEPELDLGQTDAATGVEGRHVDPVVPVVVVVEPVELRELHHRARRSRSATSSPPKCRWMSAAARRPSAIGVDQRARALGGIAAGPDAGQRGGARCRRRSGSCGAG